MEKIRLLVLFINLDTHQAILRELIVRDDISNFISCLTYLLRKDYADDRDDQVVAAAVQGIGRCAALIPDCTQQCLTALIVMIRSVHGRQLQTLRTASF